MAALTDHQLIEQTELGQGEALGQLFDRHGDGVFDFLARVVGDPDEAVHLLIDVFARIPQAAAGIPEHESIRGALFSVARETALAYLRKRGELDALSSVTPLTSATSDLANDIWQAARAMPASLRAVLAIVEHQALSPAEQAVALGITRHALQDVTAQARGSFRELFDLQTRAEGKPNTASVDAESVPGLQRRNPEADASLFTFLSMIALRDAAYGRVRNQIVAAVSSPSVQASIPAPAPVQILPRATISNADRNLAPWLMGLALIVVLVVAIITALAINGSKSSNADIIVPVIRQVDPPDGAVLPSGKRILIQATYGAGQPVAVKTVRMRLDGLDVTAGASVGDTSISYLADLGPGPHSAVVELAVTSGDNTSRLWRFSVANFTPTPTPTSLPRTHGIGVNATAET
jgi:DNA-directed RNA polymerase specialized sigma24 family protein